MNIYGVHTSSAGQYYTDPWYLKKKNESLSLHFTRPKAPTVICRRLNKQRCHSINISIEALSIFISVPLLPHSTSHLLTSYHLWVTIKWYANKLETRLKSAIFHDDSLWIQLTLRNKTFTGCLVDVFSRSFCSTMSISNKKFSKDAVYRHDNCIITYVPATHTHTHKHTKMGYCFFFSGGKKKLQKAALHFFAPHTQTERREKKGQMKSLTCRHFLSHLFQPYPTLKRSWPRHTLLTHVYAVPRPTRPNFFLNHHLQFYITDEHPRTPWVSFISDRY